MSEREIAFAMIDSFPDDQIGNVISMLRTMQQTIENRSEERRVGKEC